MPAAVTKTLFFLLASLAVAIGLLVGLAGTAPGTRWLADTLRSASAGAVDWQHIEGTLLGPLVLEGLEVHQPNLSLQLQTLQLEWRPASLLAGHLEVRELLVKGLQIEMSGAADDKPASPPLQPAEIPLPLDITLADLRVLDLVLRVGEQPATDIQRIELVASLVDRRVSLHHFALRTPQGGLAGSGQADLSAELPLELELDWDWLLPDQRQTGGALRLHGDADRLVVEHRGSGALPIAVSGELQSLLAEPGWSLALSWPELILTTQAQPLRLGPGRLASGGTLEAYSISGESGFQAPGMAPGRWSLVAEGDSAGLQIAPLNVSGEPGELELAGSVSWQGSPAFDLRYRVTAGQLSAVHPELPPSLGASGLLQGRLDGETWSIAALTLALEQAPLRLELAGAISLPTGGEPGLLATLRWRDLQWPLAAADPAYTSGAGSLTLAGAVDDYRVNFATEIAGTEVPPGEWQGEGAGDRSGLNLERLHGRLLGGELTAGGAVSWAPDLSWTLRADGHDLNPGAWLPDLPGQLSLSVRSNGRIDPNHGALVELQLDHLGGRLAGREFNLAASVKPVDDGLGLQSLRLRSGGNEVGVQGQLTPRLALEWSAELPAPGQLLPGAGGTLAASGTVTGSAESPLVQASVRGADLRLESLSVASLEAELRFGAAANDPLSVSLNLGSVQQAGEVLLENGTLQAQGTTARHELAVRLQRPAESVQAHLEGGLELAAPSWQGQLENLDIETAGYGSWQLATPAALDLAAGSVEAGEVCLQSLTDAALVCAGGGWAQGGGAIAAARLEAFPVQRLLPDLSGAVDGELNVALAADGALKGQGVVAASPGQLQVKTANGVRRLQHDGGHLDLVIGEAGLVANIRLESAGQQRAAARVELPGFNRLPLLADQPLAGRIEADFPDLSGLQALVPELGTSGGRLRGDVQLVGTLQQPGMIGDLLLSNGSAEIPVAGLKLRDIELRASGVREQPGELAVTGSLRSGPGRFDVAGRVALSGQFVELTLKGDNVEVFNTVDARALSSPDLTVAWRDEMLTLRGRILIPEAAITPKLGLSPGMAAGAPAAGAPVAEEAPDAAIVASADVVVLGADREIAAPTQKPAPPVPIDSEVELIIGDKVKVNAFGLSGQITGTVMFTNTPGQSDLVPIADGRLSIEAGTFRAFGQDLEIETGRLIYANAPVTDPEISLRAIRRIDNDPQITAAGVMISGSPGTPFLALFSRPELDPAEVQSYLLTGRSAGGRDSVLSIGTYLHPRVYVGYGYNLLEETNEFNALYTITPRYGVGANVGEADNNVNLTFTLER